MADRLSEKRIGRSPFNHGKNEDNDRSLEVLSNPLEFTGTFKCFLGTHKRPGGLGGSATARASNRRQGSATHRANSHMRRKPKCGVGHRLRPVTRTEKRYALVFIPFTLSLHETIISQSFSPAFSRGREGGFPSALR